MTSPTDRLVDTDVVSFLLKRDSRATLYRPHLADRRLIISFMTLAELDRWALERNWGEARRARMEEQLRRYVVYPSDRALRRTWAEVMVTARRRGQPIQTADAWIAATALLHGLPLVSHNRKDFAGVPGLTLISEGS